MRRRSTIAAGWLLGFTLVLLISDADWAWLYQQFGLYAAVTGIVALFGRLLSRHSPALTARQLFNRYMNPSAAVMIHAIIHPWRHTALNDGALRRITPTFAHKIL
jgi:hypothetical protein